jgi:hypothetical protein
VSEPILSREEMVILLNLLPDKIIVDYPLDNEQILTAETTDKLYEMEVYLDKDQIVSDSVLWNSERPSWSDYRQCFLASNLITYQNIEQFREEYRAYSNLRTQIVYAPDTNLFYNRFISTGEVKPEEILLVESVQKEITRMLNRKFNPSQLTELKQAVRYQRNLLDEFINGRMKQSRLAASLALQEHRGYVNRVYATAHTGDLREDKEENDLIFVESVREYQNTSNTYPVVLTCDRMLVDLCESLGVDYYLFEYPTTISPQKCSPEKLCNLICNLAGALGLVKVNNLIIYSEFRGKTGFDQYKLHYLSGETPIELERDLEICRELVKLKIEF